MRINTGSVRSLDGVENLQALECLTIAQVSALRDVKALLKLPQLQRLIIDNCKNIENIAALRDLPAGVKTSIEGTTPPS